MSAMAVTHQKETKKGLARFIEKTELEIEGIPLNECESKE